MTWTDTVEVVLADVLGEAPVLSRDSVPLTVDVPSERWTDAVTAARDRLGCGFFDWLSAVDEQDNFDVLVHLAAPSVGRVNHLLLRTRVPASSPRLASVSSLYAGAAWHERETAEMFGIEFPGSPSRDPLLLPDGFEGHPLRKDFVLASRVAKPWPGAKDPGQSDAEAAAARRRLRPPGVPDPSSWGPPGDRAGDHG